jgi:PhnB protein
LSYGTGIARAKIRFFVFIQKQGDFFVGLTRELAFKCLSWLLQLPRQTLRCTFAKKIDMEKSTIPEGHQTIMPYLILKGADRFLGFMITVFGAEETFKQMRNDNIIAHAELRINGSTIMCAEATDQWRPNTAGLFVYVKDADEIYKKAIAEGAVTIMEPADQPYGRSCGVTDPFGNIWWITSAPGK